MAKKIRLMLSVLLGIGVVSGATVWVRTVNGAKTAVAAGDAPRLRWALRLGANPNGTDTRGTSLMEQAIARRSPELVEILLQHGANADGALTRALDTLYLGFNMGPNAHLDPAVRIIRTLMETSRAKSLQRVDAEGQIRVAMETQFGGSGIRMIARTGFSSAGGDSPLRLSGLETEYVGVPVDGPRPGHRGYSVAPQGKCRVIGWKSDEGIEATRVVSLGGESRGVTIPVSGWLPSTVKEFHNRTTMGSVLKELSERGSR